MTYRKYGLTTGLALIAALGTHASHLAAQDNSDEETITGFSLSMDEIDLEEADPLTPGTTGPVDKKNLDAFKPDDHKPAASLSMLSGLADDEDDENSTGLPVRGLPKNMSKVSVDGQNAGVGIVASRCRRQKGVSNRDAIKGWPTRHYDVFSRGGQRCHLELFGR